MTESWSRGPKSIWPLTECLHVVGENVACCVYDITEPLKKAVAGPRVQGEVTGGKKIRDTQGGFREPLRVVVLS